MVPSGGKGVLFSDFPVSIGHQQFQVHHVVDDDGKVPAVAVPAADGADGGIEAGGQFPGTGAEDAVDLPGGKTVLFPDPGGRPPVEAAHQLEADVVVRFPLQEGSQRQGMLHGERADRGIPCLPVNLPQAPRIEPAAPPSGVGGYKGIPLECPGTPPLGQDAVQIHGLHLREGKHPGAEFLHGFLLRGAAAGEGRSQGENPIQIVE